MKRGEITSVDPKHVANSIMKKFRRLKTVFSHSSNDEEAFYSCQVYHVIYDQTGDYIITGGNDKLIKIFDAKSLKILKTLRGHSSELAILTMSSNNEFIVSSGENGEIRVWAFPSGQPVAVLNENKGKDITSLTVQEELMHDGQLKSFQICTSPTNGLFIYEDLSFIHNEGLVCQDQKHYKLRGYAKYTRNEVGFTAEEIHPKNGLLATFALDGNIYIWDRLRDLFKHNRDPTWTTPIQKITGVGNEFARSKEFVNWSPDGKCLLNISDDTMRYYQFDFEKKIFLKYFEMVNKDDIHHRRKNVDKMALNAWSNQGKFGISCFNTSTTLHGEHMPINTKLYFYNTSLGKIQHMINGENTSLNLKTNFQFIEAHPLFEQFCLTGDHEGQVIVWNCITGTALNMFLERGVHINFPLINLPVVDCKFSPCGKFFVTSTIYGCFSLYGYGHEVNFLHQPYEQFFSRDSEFYSINEQTGEVLDVNGQKWDHTETGFQCNLQWCQYESFPEENTEENVQKWISRQFFKNKIFYGRYAEHEEQMRHEISQFMKKEKKRHWEYIVKIKEQKGIPIGHYDREVYEMERKKIIFGSNNTANQTVLVLNSKTGTLQEPQNPAETLNNSFTSRDLGTSETQQVINYNMSQQNSLTQNSYNLNLEANYIGSTSYINSSIQLQQQQLNVNAVSNDNLNLVVEYWDDRIKTSYQNYQSTHLKKCDLLLNSSINNDQNTSIVDKNKAALNSKRRNRLIISSEENSQQSGTESEKQSESPEFERKKPGRRGRPRKNIDEHYKSENEFEDSEKSFINDDDEDEIDDDSDLDNDDYDLTRTNNRRLQRNKRRKGLRQKKPYGYDYNNPYNDSNNQRSTRLSKRNNDRSVGNQRKRSYNYEEFDEENYGGSHLRTRTKVKMEEHNNGYSKNQLNEESDFSGEAYNCFRCMEANARQACVNFEICGKAFHEKCGEVRGKYYSNDFYCFECLVNHISKKDLEKGPQNQYSFEGKNCEREWQDILYDDPDNLQPQIGDQYYFIPQAYECFISRFFDIINFADNPFEAKQGTSNYLADYPKEDLRNQLKNGGNSTYATRNHQKKSGDNSGAKNSYESQNKVHEEDSDDRPVTIWPFETSEDLHHYEKLIEVIDVAYEFPRPRTKGIEKKYEKYRTIFICLKMKVINIDNKDKSNNSIFDSIKNSVCKNLDVSKEEQVFYLRYFPTSDEPKFLVPKNLYEKSIGSLLSYKPHANQQFEDETLIYDDRECYEDSFPYTYFRSVRVRSSPQAAQQQNQMITRRSEREKFGESEVFSPWEQEFTMQQVEHSQRRKKKEDLNVSNQDAELILLNQSDREVMEVFSEGLKKFIEKYNDYFVIFFDRVNTDEHQTYLDFIKVEMYLEKIQKRLKGSYYHSVRSLIADMTLIKVNAFLFNEQTSQVCYRSQLFVDMLISLLNGDMKKLGEFDAIVQEDLQMYAVKTGGNFARKFRKRENGEDTAGDEGYVKNQYEQSGQGDYCKSNQNYKSSRLRHKAISENTNQSQNENQSQNQIIQRNPSMPGGDIRIRNFAEEDNEEKHGRNLRKRRSGCEVSATGTRGPMSKSSLKDNMYSDLDEEIEVNNF